jgi:hypothetical protein
MKNYGKVTVYNGLFGKIKGVDGLDYVLLDKNLVDNGVRVLDNVEFESEVFQTLEVELQMARFVKRFAKEQTQQRSNK